MPREMKYHGLPGWALEDGGLRAVILRQGGKLVSLFDRSREKEWLWSPKDVPPHRYGGSCFDEEWFGGMDDLFPCDPPYKGKPLYRLIYADHGCFWNRDWTARPLESGLELKCRAAPFTLSKRLSAADGALQMRYRIHSEARERLPFLFRLHPAFELAGALELEIPGEQAVCDREGNRPPPGADRYPWPHYPAADGSVTDLSRCADFREGQTVFQYIRLRQGRFSLWDSAARCGLSFAFPLEVFPWVTLFASNGGWRGNRVLAAEPSSGYPADLGESVEQGGARWLEPGESLSFTVEIRLSEEGRGR